MMLNVERYRYGRRRKPRRGWLVLALVVALGGGGTAAWLLGAGQLAQRWFRPQAHSAPLAELWKNRLYDDIIKRADQRLKADPLEGEALVYRGFSYFYKAVSEGSQEDRLPYLEESITSLRRAKLAKSNPWPAETDYVLGKAYYHKGKYYYDLTLRYLERALAAGFQSADIYDYLGLAATQLERVEEGLAYFQKALAINPTDLLLLMMGQSYRELGRLDESEEYLLRALNKTEDPAIEKKCRFLLGQLYFERRDYFKAEKEYQNILARDPDSADAHFYLGEIYAALNDKVKARAEWRKTLILDPSHYGAKLRYYK
jgi:tetratricopeptide (TPR) repeat protein